MWWSLARETRRCVPRWRRRQQGARVLVLERAPESERGGNSRYTAGAIRFVYNGLDDLLKVMPDLPEDEQRETDFGTYTRDQYFNDMARITQYRSDPEMTATLIDRSLDTMVWMREQGVRFSPSYSRQAFKVDGHFKFWGGLSVEVSGGGPGLIESLNRAAARSGIDVQYGTRAVSLIEDEGVIRRLVARKDGKRVTIEANAVVLASGGFEANAEWRTRYLGPGWDLAKVRGTRYNTGDGIKMALDVGALPYGNWSGGHAVAWDRNAPDFGDLRVGDNFQKHCYPFGIIVNANGERFVDEGADFRNYTYAKYGHEILHQPQQFAWQVFDSKVTHLLRDEYRIREVTKVRANTLEELAEKLDDVDRRELPANDPRLQRRGAHRHPVQSDDQGRTSHRGHHAAQVELGQPDRMSESQSIIKLHSCNEIGAHPRDRTRLGTISARSAAAGTRDESSTV